MSSKGIDYSKFDHIGDTSSDEEDEAKAAARTPRRDAPGEKQSEKSPASLEDLQKLQSLLGKCMKEGNIRSIMTKDLVSASVLLSAVTPDGIEKRRKAAARKEELADDPVRVHLWDLTMKIREDDKHADELLQVNVIDRILSVIENCKPEKYTSRHITVDVRAGLQKLGEAMTPYEKILAKRLRSDINDICSSLSVLHEMCRYRSGCVALAQHKKCLAFLLNDIPFEETASLGASLSAKFDLGVTIGGAVIGSQETDWGDHMKYNFGMIEQATIDTFGRLLNGLDKHASLRREVGELIQTKIDAFEARLLFILTYMSNEVIMKDPQVGHCINIKSSLSRLRKLLSTLDSNPTAWRSTFRIDRHLVPRVSSNKGDGGGGGDDKVDPCADKRKCRVCAKPMKKQTVCSRCKSVFYCSRECQRQDWRVHKQNCVKHRDEVPIDSEWAGEFYKDMMGKVTDELEKKIADCGES